MAPSGTGFLTPLRLPPDAVSLIASGDGLPLPSNSASVPIASPDAIMGSHFLLLRVAAGEQDGFGRQIDRGGERHRRQRAAHFFRDHAEFEMARARAAECFRDCDTEKAHLGKTLPQLAVIRLLAVEHHAHRFRRAFLGEEFPRFVAHLLLFVGEIEIHGVLLGLCDKSELVIPRARVQTIGEPLAKSFASHFNGGLGVSGPRRGDDADG